MEKLIERMKNIIVEHFNDNHLCRIDTNDLYLEKVACPDNKTTCLFSLLSQGNRSIMYEVSYYEEYPHFEVKIFAVQKMFIEY